MNYQQFLESKSHTSNDFGFEPKELNSMLYDFQSELVLWALRKGRAAIFADCGLGKTPMQLEWARCVSQHENGRVLVLTPLAVAHQTAKEGGKFGIPCEQSKDGTFSGRIVVTNYEKLHFFSPADFIGVVCDESSILKNFDGARRGSITEFMKKMPYRLLCTATAAPNDYIELGTSSEALGVMGYMDMLNRFFKNDQNTSDTKQNFLMRGGERRKWRFKKHAENPFWRWICSWARAIRRPSDIGFDDAGFILPPLIEHETVIPCSRPMPGKLFVEPARSLKEQRQERRATLSERCEAAAEKINHNSIAVVWCHLNDEGDLLTRLIDGAEQVAGSMTDDRKEDIFRNFSDGNIRVLVTKPKIGAFGLNWQHCAHMTTFPSHSWEQYYQSTRRLWRFGQVNDVLVDIITTEGETSVLANLQRKARAADKMFSKLVKFMNHAQTIDDAIQFTQKERIPAWLS